MCRTIASPRLAIGTMDGGAHHPEHGTRWTGSRTFYRPKGTALRWNAHALRPGGGVHSTKARRHGCA